MRNIILLIHSIPTHNFIDKLQNKENEDNIIVFAHNSYCI